MSTNEVWRVNWRACSRSWWIASRRTGVDVISASVEGPESAVSDIVKVMGFVVKSRPIVMWR